MTHPNRLRKFRFAVAAAAIGGLPGIAAAHLSQQVPVISWWVADAPAICVVRQLGAGQPPTGAAPGPAGIATRIVSVQTVTNGRGCPDAPFTIEAEMHHLAGDGNLLLFATPNTEPNPRAPYRVLFDHPAVSVWPGADPVAATGVLALSALPLHAPPQAVVPAKGFHKLKPPGDGSAGILAALKTMLGATTDTARAAVFTSLRADPALASLHIAESFCSTAAIELDARIPGIQTATAFSLWVSSMRASVDSGRCVERLLTVPDVSACTPPQKPIPGQPVPAPKCLTRLLTSSSIQLLPRSQRMTWRGLCEAKGFDRICSVVAP